MSVHENVYTRTQIQGIHRHQIPPGIATSLAKHRHTAHYGQTWHHL